MRSLSVKPRRYRPQGFTLLELVVVAGLIAVLAAFFIGGLAGGGKGAALSSAQSSLVNLVTAARLQAAATGRKTRILLSIDRRVPERFLRYLVWQRAQEAGPNPLTWDILETVALPPGCYVVPGNLNSLPGLVEHVADWTRRSDPTQSLASDLFGSQSLSYVLEGDGGAQLWTGVAFTPQGTLAVLTDGVPPKGALLLALGTPRSPETWADGESPVRLINPRAVRGLLLSAYGVPAIINDREAL